LNVTTDGVLTGVTDSELDAITAKLLTVPLSGTLVFNMDGTFIYKPVIEFQGQVSFVYQAYDGKQYSDPITVTIDVYLPKNLPSSGSGDSGSSGGSRSSDSGSGSGGSGTVVTPSNVDSAALPSPPVGGVPSATDGSSNAQNAVAAQPEVVQGIESDAKETNMAAFVETRESIRIADLAAALSRRVLRIHSDQWSTIRDSDSVEMLRNREEEVYHGRMPSDEQTRRASQSNESVISLDAGTVVSTVIGTGAILWVVQATQLAATFITAASPTWLQVDIASTINNLAREKTASDEATAKIFE
jgi:hypothetical protein